MVDIVTRVNNVVNGFVWGPFGLALLLCTGLWLSVRTGFFQFRRMGYWLKHTIGAIFTNKDVTAHTSKEDMAISQFQSMCTALAGTIGTGNIVGVATAIVSGGPGAIFWMWVMALLGMMTSFAENVLGVYYRRKNEKGEWNGGAMYYLTDGLGAKPGCKAVGKVLAVLFACFCILASFGIGNMSQCNSIAQGLSGSFGIPSGIVGAVTAVLLGAVLLGGLKRLSRVTETLVPFMALFYMAGCVVILCINHAAIIPAFKSIFVAAFDPQAILGGAAGITVRQAMRYGVARGLFSNEAGMGSTPHAHALAKVKRPQDQGEIAIVSVFIDTFIVLTLTAMVILTSGMLNPGAPDGLQGTELAQAAFKASLGSAGMAFVAICMLFFAFSTIIGWYFFGEQNVKALFGHKAVKVYAAIVVICIVIGSALHVDLVWNLSDLFNGLMVFPNLIALLALSGLVAKAAHDKDIMK